MCGLGAPLYLPGLRFLASSLFFQDPVEKLPRHGDETLASRAVCDLPTRWETLSCLPQCARIRTRMQADKGHGTARQARGFVRGVSPCARPGKSATAASASLILNAIRAV